MAHHRPTRPSGRAMPVNGLVLFGGEVHRIVAVDQPAHGQPSYRLLPAGSPGGAPRNVGHAELVRHLSAAARYTVGQRVLLARSAPMNIIKRQWDFRTGTIWYYAAVPNRTIGAGWFNQGTMLSMDRELHTVPDTDVVPTRPGRSSPPPDWL